MPPSTCTEATGRSRRRRHGQTRWYSVPLSSWPKGAVRPLCPAAKRPAWCPGRAWAALLGAAGLWPSALVGRERRTLAAALALAAVVVWVQNKYFNYHWQTAQPFLALLTAAGGCLVVERLSIPRRLLPSLAAAAAV